ATLKNGTSNATGTITFQLFSDAGCTKQVGGDVTKTVAGADNKDYASPAITVNAAGTYHWVASYVSGDANNKDAATACGDANENPVGTEHRPAGTTNAGGPYTHKADGTVDLSDTETLKNGTSNATGTITFQLFSDAGCTKQVGGDVTKTVAGADNKDYASPAITVNAAGTYHWVASYVSGDANNKDAATACGDANENPVVNPLGPALTTNAGGPYTLKADGTVDLSDTPTLKHSSPTRRSSDLFQLFSDAGCTKQVGGDVTKTVAGADNKDYASPAITVNAAGT